MVHESKKSDSARKKSANVTTKTNSESGRRPSPTPPLLRPLSPHCYGFSAKKVRTSSKNCRNFAQNSESAENGERIAECGGRGAIPPRNPPSPPPPSFFGFFGIFLKK